MENELTDFLRRLPWASHDLLQNYFGRKRFDEMLQECSQDIKTIMRADNRQYYSLQPGNDRLLPGISRREMVRKFMAEMCGYGIFETAESPCFNADFRAFSSEQNMWIRVWGDMGHIAPESLMIFNNPPVFGNRLRDIILTCEGIERARFLDVQAETHWQNAQENSAAIYQTEEPGLPPLIPDTGYKKNMQPYDPVMENYAEITGSDAHIYNDTHKRKISIQEIRSREICCKSRNLAQEDYELICFIACNPFFRMPEIALIFGGDSSDRDDVNACGVEYKKIINLTHRIPELAETGLIKEIRSGPMKESYIPTWEGLDLIAAYHGTIPLYLKKYSQWPQQSFEKEDFEAFRHHYENGFSFFDSHTYYKQRWGSLRPEHQKLCNEFGAALICGARSKKAMERKKINVSGLTTISSNLKISAVSHGRKTIKQLHPDGSCTVEWGSPGFEKRWKVFIEIERNTNSGKKLLGKIEKYRKFIHAAKQFYSDYDDVIVMFFFDDTCFDSEKAQEKGLLMQEEMKKNGIRGFVGFRSDALRAPANWVNKNGDIETQTCGGLMLFQNMWLTTDSWPDKVKHPFPCEYIV